jgi:hypothetical protein
MIYIAIVNKQEVCMKRKERTYPPDVARFRELVKLKRTDCMKLSRRWRLHVVTVRGWHCGSAQIPPGRLKQLEAL